MYYGHNRPGSDPQITPMEAVVVIVVIGILVAPFIFGWF